MSNPKIKNSVSLNFSLKDNTFQYITACVLIFAAVFLLFHDLFLGKIIATNDISTSDLLYFYLPVKTLYGEALRNGELLQWTPYIYGGFPVFAEGQGGFLYPLNLIIWYLLNPVAAMNAYIIVHALIMGIGVYFLASKITANNLISIPSAVAASICGSIIAGHTRHLNSLTAIVYAPWLIYTVELFFRTRKVSRGLIFGILLGLLVLGGHPQHAFISGFFAVLYLFLRLLFENKPPAKFFSKVKSYKALNFLFLALIISLLIGFPQIKSTLELLPYTERAQELTSEFTGLGSLPFNGIFTFIYPYYMGNIGDYTFKSDYPFFFWEFFYYSGVIIFILAVYGVVKMRKRNEFRGIILSLVIIAVVSYLFALGENLGAYKIFSLFPFTKSFRFPARWLAGMELSVLVLSCFGVLSIAELFSRRKEALPEKTKSKEQKAKPSLAKNPEAIISIQFKTAVVISLAVILEIYFVAGRQVATADSATYLQPPSFVNKIKEENKPILNARNFTVGRVEFLTGAFQKSKGWEGKHDLFGLGAKLLPPELGAYFGVPIIDGYFLLVPNYIYEIWGDADHSGIIGKTASLQQNKIFQPTDKFIKLSRLFSVKFITIPWSIPPPYEQVWDSAGVKAYRLPDTLHKAWVVSNVFSFGSDNEKNNAEKLIDDKFDPYSSAYVNGAAPVIPADSKNGSAEILNYDNHSVTIKASQPGFVIINDTWYPRWKAYIEGVEVPVYKTNVMMRGVIAPKAGTIIEMKFDKGNVFIFAVISYLVIFICIGYLYYEKRKMSFPSRIKCGINSSGNLPVKLGM